MAPSMPLFCGDYLADTMHLSMEQSGAYLHILMATWRNGGRALPDDSAMLARICRMTVPRFRDRVRPAIVGFFDLSGGTWRNLRLEKEWEYVAKRAAIARGNGAAGGRPKSPPPDNQGENFSKNGAQTGEKSGSLRDAKPLKSNGAGNPGGSPRVTQDESTQPQPLDSLTNIQDSCEGGLGGIDPPRPVSEKVVRLRPRAPSRWPEGRAVPAGWIEEAHRKRAERRLPRADLELEADKFVMHYTGDDAPRAVKRDWHRAFVKWCLHPFVALERGRAPAARPAGVPNMKARRAGHV